MAQSTEFSSLHGPVPVDKQWGLTEVKHVKIVYTWTIDKFSFCIENVGDYIKSPTFTTKGYDDIKWRIDLHPKALDNIDFVSIFIKLISNKNNCVKGRVHLSLLNSNQQERNLVSSPEIVCANPLCLPGGNFYSERKFITRNSLLDKAQSLLPEDKLTVRCKLVVMVDIINTNGREGIPQFKIQRDCISDYFVKLFNDMRLSDVTLVAEGKEIRAHKLILAARSAVFAAMFEHDMQEQKLSRVDITDVDHDILKEMLSFMYTDRTPNLDKMAADLLVAADKYALESLKVQCEEALSKNLSIETAADTMVLANLHSAALLKEHTIAYINSQNATMVIATEGWKKMTITYPHLVAELFRAARGE